MKRILTLALFILPAYSFLQAQTIESKITILPSGKKNSAAAGIAVSLGNFSETHVGGVSIEYSRSNNRFGRMAKRPSKQIGFTCNAGVAYYFGKEEKIVTTTYKYPAYTYLHIYGGAIYNISKEANIILTAGPALGLYNGTTAFNIGAQLEGSYYINERIALTPGLLLMKENESDPLWAGSLKVNFIF